jgi:RimJ/RimL family protein N-acetyltransferase
MLSIKKDENLSPPSKVELIEGRQKKGHGAHDFYWHIYSNHIRAGQVYIDYIEDPVIGKHASIHIFLNKKSQGKGIGRIGYREACTKSKLNVIYAHMRKNNIASKKAALAAGFFEVKNEKFNQLVMMWQK